MSTTLAFKTATKGKGPLDFPRDPTVLWDPVIGAGPFRAHVVPAGVLLSDGVKTMLRMLNKGPPSYAGASNDELGRREGFTKKGTLQRRNAKGMKEVVTPSGLGQAILDVDGKFFNIDRVVMTGSDGDKGDVGLYTLDNFKQQPGFYLWWNQHFHGCSTADKKVAEAYANKYTKDLKSGNTAKPVNAAKHINAAKPENAAKPVNAAKPLNAAKHEKQLRREAKEKIRADREEVIRKLNEALATKPVSEEESSDDDDDNEREDDGNASHPEVHTVECEALMQRLLALEETIKEHKKEANKQHDILIKEAARVRQIEITRLHAHESIIINNLEIAFMLIKSGPSKDRAATRARFYRNCIPYLEKYSPDHDDNEPPRKRSRSD